MAPEVVQQIASCVAAGEGVVQILVDMKIDPRTGTDELRKHHRAEIKAAKEAQRKQ